jgi:hypothetical protein
MLLTSILIAACGPGGKRASTPDQITEVTEAPNSVSLRRTRIAGVDAVTDAVFSGDPETLRSFVKFTSIACTTNPPGLGGTLVCKPDEAGGTVVEAFPEAGCEGHYVRPDEMDPLMQSLTGDYDSLYAVYLPTANLWPPGDYVVVLSENVPDLGAIGGQLMITDGRLVGVKASCGRTPEQVMQDEPLDKVMLPPE